MKHNIMNAYHEQTKQDSHSSTKFEHTMMPHLLCLLPFPTVLILLFLSWLSPSAGAQSTAAECGPYLLALAPCEPFVQGMAATPVQTCCDNLDRLHGQKPACLCLLLHDTSLAPSSPINTTLALQLPLLCNLQIDPNTCPGASAPGLLPPTQVSFGAKPKSSAAGGISSSPIVTGSPRPGLMGFGFHQSAELRLTAEGRLSMLLTAATFVVLTKYG